MSTVLFTGCMGFIASNTIPLFLKAGHTVIGVDNLLNPSHRPTERMKAAAGKAWRNFHFYECDITSQGTLLSIALNSRVDTIVHLAAVGSVPRSFSDPMNTMHNNVLGFTSVALLAQKINAKLIFASSSSVYGERLGSQEKPCVEGEEGECISPYALSKRMNEDFARVWCKSAGVPYIGLRFFNVYGPGQRADSPYSALIPRLCVNPKPVIYGDGLQARDFTFVDDVAQGIFHAAYLCSERDFVCNLAPGRPSTVLEVAELIGCRPEIHGAREGDIRYSYADTKYCEQKLGYVPRGTLKDGLTKTKSYYGGKNGNGKKSHLEAQKEV